MGGLITSLHGDTMVKRQELSEVKQYNPFAKTYSEVFVENNRNSITAYFSHLNIPLKGKNVLDLGCGDGYDLSQIKLKEASIFGIDSSEEMIKLAQQKNPEG